MRGARIEEKTKTKGEEKSGQLLYYRLSGLLETSVEKIGNSFPGDQAQCPVVLFLASSPLGRRPSIPKEGNQGSIGYTCLQPCI